MHGIMVRLRLLLLVFSWCAAASWGCGQGQFLIHSLRGEVQLDGAFDGDLMVRVYELSTRELLRQTFVGSDGSFELTDIVSGRYYVAVMQGNGQVLSERMLDLGDFDFAGP